MKSASFIVFLLSLGIIAYQDFKQRAISWWTLPIMFVSYMLYSVYPIEQIVNSFFFNMLFVLLNLLAITLYFSLKASTFVNVIDTKIGLGDLLFLVVCCAVFNLPTFVLFFTISLIISVIVALIFQSSTKENHIPLAGIMAVLLVIVCLSGHFMSLELTRDIEWINTLLLG